MALQTANGSPPSNSLSLSEVNTELGKSSTTQIALNDADVRGLIGKGVNETFGMIELYGASSVVGWIRVMPFDITNHSSTTTSVVFDSSDNMYALILNTQKSRSGSWNNTALAGNYELYKFNSSNVEQANVGFSLDHMNGAQNIYASGSFKEVSKIILRGTSDIYAYLPRKVNTYFPHDGISMNATVMTVTKHNQSNLLQEHDLWHHFYMNSRPHTASFGNDNYLSAGSYGREAQGDYGMAAIDKNNKLTVCVPAKTNASTAYWMVSRYGTDPQYTSAPEIMSAYRMTDSGGTSYWNQTNVYSRVVIRPVDTSWNWYWGMDGNSHRAYCLFKDSATRSQPTTANGYGGLIGSNDNSNSIVSQAIHQHSSQSRPETMVLDHNNNPSVFGYGGIKTQNNTTVDGGVWCQTHNSDGTKNALRFQFTLCNYSSSDYSNGGFEKAVYDSSGNCYMAGWNNMSRMANNSDLNFYPWGSGSTSYPYITWVAKFNSSGVYQWHTWFSCKEWALHYPPSGLGTGGQGGNQTVFSSTYGNAYTQRVTINDLTIDPDNNLIVSGQTPFYGGVSNATGAYRTNFILNLPADGSHSAGFVGHTDVSVNSSNRNVGIYLGKVTGDGQSSTSQFYWSNNTTGNCFSNDQYTRSGDSQCNVYCNLGRPRSTYGGTSGTQYNTSTLPCITPNSVNVGYRIIAPTSDSQNSSGSPRDYTPPAELTNASTFEEF
tara:strand:- start:807 stop:2951 length:2145 start_codon:yes stop_codon:yes gene_type:complete